MFTRSDQPITASAVRTYAMELLARREYGAAELAKKLAVKFDHSELIGGVLAGLQADNLQCDRRFAESFVRSRIGRGHGPLRIRREIGQRGIGAELHEAAVALCDPDWFELARELRLRRFPVVGSDQKLRARVQRFLSYRGFGYDQISYAMQERDGD